LPPSLSPASGDEGSETSTRGRIVARTVALSLAFWLTTTALFVAYRTAFLFWFAPATPLREALAIIVAGMRLDSALVAAELMFIAAAFLLLRYFRLRGFAAVLVVLTFVHVLLGIANILFFAERNQHLWEMLIANIGHPSELVVAVEPHIHKYPVEWMTGLLLFVALVAAAWLLCRRIPVLKIDLWRSRQRWRSAALILVLFIPTMDVVAYQQTKYWTLGWIPLPAASQFYMRFDRYEANQAVINPVHDLVRFYVPATLAGIGGSNAGHLATSDAIRLTQSLLGVRPLNDSYPLLQDLPAGPQLGLKNVVVIIVEGLSQSILHRKEDGQDNTPFLTELSRRGLSFPNFVQSYNATDGSVLSIVAGMYKTFVNQHWQYFLPTEVNSYFGSLPHLLGRDKYKHYAMFGFHNRREDFAAFLRNQGFETFDIAAFHELLGDRRRKQEIGNALGLFDHVLFEESAKLLAIGPSPFTATLITTTTHSPWVAAQHAPSTFKNARLNTFRYLDDSIRAFVTELKNLRSYDETLFVITGDHTSITFSGDAMEQLQVPLIMYAPRLEDHVARLNVDRAVMASHVDIVPTILQLLDGAHPYSGMGVSLISPDRSNARVVSSNRFNSLYFRDGHALRFSPSSPGPDDTHLFAVKDGQMLATGTSQLDSALLKRLRHELLVLTETSTRLTKEKRVFPMRRDARDMAGVN
jgi:phosphoglycerol transferase MdoB-like AlkP superfamily enzyme